MLETIAGKNRANIAASILQNSDMLRSVYEDSQTSEGSAQEELDKYLDSIEGKIQKLNNSIQEFWFNFIDSDAVKWFIDFLTNAVDLGTQLVKTLGSVPTLVGAVASVLSVKNIAQGNSGGRAKKCALFFCNIR